MLSRANARSYRLDIGIGLAIARLRGGGRGVMINGFGDADEIEAIRAELAQTSGAPALYDAADLTNADAIDAMIARCADDIAATHIIVNNAACSSSRRSPTFGGQGDASSRQPDAGSTPRAALAGNARQEWPHHHTASAHSLVARPTRRYVAAKHGARALPSRSRWSARLRA